MKAFFLLLIVLPFAAQAQIYSCEARGETYFSQIPCAENARIVTVEDRTMFSESNPKPDSQPEETSTPAPVARTPADNMQEFVMTLRRQRGEQLQQIDQDIERLTAQMDALGDRAEESDRKKFLQERLLALQASKDSVDQEYEGMIAEAESRVASLSDKGLAAENKVD